MTPAAASWCLTVRRCVERGLRAGKRNIDPGENVTLMFAFRAAGGTNINKFSATLLATNGVTSPSPVRADASMVH